MFIGSFDTRKIIKSLIMGLFSSLVNGVSSFLTNNYNNAYQYSLYRQQQADSLRAYRMQRDDNIRMWEMQNDYNSPTTQANLARAAGVNPDFNGLAPSAAGSVSPANYNVPQQGFSPLSIPVMELDGIISDVFSTIQQYRNLQSMNLDLEGKKVDIFNKLSYDWMIRNGIDPLSTDSVDGLNVYRPFADKSEYPFLSRSMRKKFADFASEYVPSLRAKYSYLGDTNKYEEEIKSWRERNADPLFSASFDLGDNILKFAQIMRDAEYQSYKASRSKSFYNQGYYDNLNPSAAATAENIANEHKAFQERLMRDITRELDKHISNKDWFNAWLWLKLRTSIQTGQTGLSKFGSSLGSVAGAAVGGPAGAAVGGALGGLL